MLNRMVGTPARWTLPALILAVSAAPAAAQQQPPQAAQQREHVVRRGDTLWDLARQYLSNPFLWPMIYEANRNVVEDPHWIYPAERLIIPPLLQRLEQPEPIGHPPLPTVVRPPAPEGVPVAPDTTVAADTTPTMVATLDMRRPVISAGEYLRLPWLSPTADPGLTGRIARRAEAAAVAERIAPALYPHERVQVSVTAGGVPAPGDSLMVVRVGRRVAGQGTLVEPLALLRVDTAWSGNVLATIVSQFGEARVGDAVMRLVPVPDIGFGRADPVADGIEGRLLEFLAESPMHATTDLAFISLGRRDGVRIGDEFAVYVPAEAGTPPLVTGTVRVVHVGEQTATVRVLSVNSTVLGNGLPVRMVRRMP